MYVGNFGQCANTALLWWDALPQCKISLLMKGGMDDCAAFRHESPSGVAPADLLADWAEIWSGDRSDFRRFCVNLMVAHCAEALKNAQDLQAVTRSAHPS